MLPIWGKGCSVLQPGRCIDILAVPRHLPVFCGVKDQHASQSSQERNRWKTMLGYHQKFPNQVPFQYRG